LRRYFKHTVVQNALSLYGLQIAEYVLPMISMPYLARVLGPAGWGPIIFAQAFAGWTSLLMEYGFQLSATREIARTRDSAESRAEIVAGIMSANALLFLLLSIVSLICLLTIPAFRTQPVYFWWAFVIAFTNGIKPIWYFLGVEKMRFPSIVNLGGRIVYTALIFVFVTGPDKGWIILALQGISSVAVAVVLFVWMYRDVPWHVPNTARGLAALRMGWSMFLFRSAVSLYTVANTFILGLFVTPSVVAFYGGAERSNKAAQAFMQPLSLALFPRMSHLIASNLPRAAQVARRTLLLFGGLSLVIGASIAMLAPFLLGKYLGPGYGPTVPVFQVLAILLPLIAISNVLGVQWMWPLGMDREINRIIMVAGGVNIAIAVYLAPRSGAVGMAWAVVIAEAFVTLAYAVVLHRSGKAFWQKTGPHLEVLPN
jgi:PST family polysaccharide transporter